MTLALPNFGSISGLRPLICLFICWQDDVFFWIGTYLKPSEATLPFSWSQYLRCPISATLLIQAKDGFGQPVKFGGLVGAQECLRLESVLQSAH